MFVRLLVTFFLLILVVQSALINSSKGQNVDNLKLQKQEPLDYDYDPTDPNLLGGNIEGSGGAASLDEYADDEEEEELSRITAKAMPTTRSTTIITTTTPTTTKTTTTTTTTTTSTASTTRSTMTTKRSTTTLRTTTATTTLVPPWMRNYESRTSKTRSTTTTLSTFLDPDASEFKDDQEEYPDELEDDAYDNELAMATRLSTMTTTTTTTTTTRYMIPITRHSSNNGSSSPVWVLFKFLTRPPIAAGILAGLAIGIFTSIILLICIIQRYNKRDKSHSSYTTGLLYPNQYGYSKSPQEFYA